MTPTEFKTIRQRNGHTQASLAAWAGVSVATVQAIEQGRRNPGGALIKLMEMLNGPVAL